MKLKSLMLCGAVASLAILGTSCKKEQGCTNPDAINYNANAEEDDGSCILDNNGSNIIHTGVISADETWAAADKHLLSGFVRVAPGVTLTIEPGTVVKASPGEGQFASALIIQRGAKINAAGTASAPIIFTSSGDAIEAGQIASPNLDPNQNGLWGGVIILGKAQISAQNSGGDVTELQIEGIPTAIDARYGGNDDADNSGVFTYVSIRHGGSNIGAGNEINGLTLGGVGSGTTINNIEVVANQDDGIEWFGGSVSINNVVIWNSGDDGLDTDQDWIGTCSDFIIVTPRGGSAFELDGPEGSLNRGTHQFNNGVVYAGNEIDHLVDWDGGTNAGVSNVYFYGIDPSYMEIVDDPNTPDDETFKPVESFGGDGTGVNTGWQYTLPAGAAAVDKIFTGVPAGNLTSVGENANTVGPNSSEFGWTWAGASGALGGIGL